MKGMIQGFTTEIEASNDAEVTVSYSVRLAEQEYTLKGGEGLTFQYVGGANCKHCGVLITAAGRDYCFDCFRTLARCDLCVMSPNRCHHHKGTCREPDWGDSFCMQPHVVYLALAHVPKVGITRAGREWYRWSDQGAHKALRLMTVPTRRMAGVVEAHLSQWITDRTDWRKLVTGQRGDFSLTELAVDLMQRTPDLGQFRSDQISDAEVDGAVWEIDPRETNLSYPVQDFSPAEQLRVDSAQEVIADNLQGVIGGYLLLSRGVMSMQSLSRGDIQLELGDPVVLEERPQMSLF
ncbi:MAG: DUF2797 domain-containing protein [Pseudomonadales bacterium]|nr:DUF2797 domain-containing protein [Pseudomonadales bacterium]